MKTKDMKSNYDYFIEWLDTDFAELSKNYENDESDDAINTKKKILFETKEIFNNLRKIPEWISTGVKNQLFTYIGLIPYSNEEYKTFKERAFRTTISHRMLKLFYEKQYKELWLFLAKTKGSDVAFTNALVDFILIEDDIKDLEGIQKNNPGEKVKIKKAKNILKTIDKNFRFIMTKERKRKMKDGIAPYAMTAFQHYDNAIENNKILHSPNNTPEKREHIISMLLAISSFLSNEQNYLEEYMDKYNLSEKVVSYKDLHKIYATPYVKKRSNIKIKVMFHNMSLFFVFSYF